MLTLGACDDDSSGPSGVEGPARVDQADVELEGATLSFGADVTPAQVTVEAGGEVEDVGYTVNSATCNEEGA